MSSITVPGRAGVVERGARRPGLWAARVPARLAVFAQVVVLLICAYLTWGGHQATIMKSNDVAAWWAPMRGTWGAAIVLGQAASLVVAWLLTRSRRSSIGGLGHLVLLGWLGFWAFGFGRVAWISGDWAAAGLVPLTLALAVCEGVLWRVSSRARSSAAF